LSRRFFLHVGSRQILHFDIHTNPTTNWMRKVLKFAVRKQIQAGKTFHYFLSDNDSIFGKRFTKYLERIGIKHKKPLFALLGRTVTRNVG
ncbi:hypothetical protein LEP1GSC043_3920, partial [Leptospira weilii str. Ecochallenge]